ncbi:MAG TPA: ABC transporter ATP-binding protein, partial [Acidimicrobiales bacterium]|nr:ABC transporter ATP-binding protein [Acidimicrobiales bacterium]
RLPALSIRNIKKKFGGVQALDGINLSVSPGQVVGIIGSNGSGKTTLLDVCSGLTIPDTGTVGIFGKEVNRLRPHERAFLGLGRVFQNTPLFPSVSVLDAVSIALETRVKVRDPFADALRLHDSVASERDIRKLALAALNEVGLSAWKDNLVSELSTGLRRLLEIACVLAHRPRLLLLDEPSAGIAQRERGPLAEVIAGLKSTTGATCVVVEHDIPLISRIADHLVCLHLGTVLAQGLPKDVLTDQAVIDSYLGIAQPLDLENLEQSNR